MPHLQPQVKITASEGAAGTSSAHLGILLPLDYSGMQHESLSISSAYLLRETDTQACLALRAQTESCANIDDLRTVYHRFKHVLASIDMPPPASVKIEQARKDAAREWISIRGNDDEGAPAKFRSDVDGVLLELERLLRPLVTDPQILEFLVGDVLRASSRTSWGGDAYAVISDLLVKDELPATPAQCESFVDITVSKDSIICIDSRSAFNLYASMDAFCASTSSASLTEGEGATEVSDSPLLIYAQTRVSLSVLDGSCSRILSISCPYVDSYPVCSQFFFSSLVMCFLFWFGALTIFLQPGSVHCFGG